MGGGTWTGLLDGVSHGGKSDEHEHERAYDGAFLRGATVLACMRFAPT